MKGIHKHPAGPVHPVLNGLSLIKRTHLRRLGATVLVVMLVGVLPALAATVDISIPLETIVWGAKDSTHVLAVVEVPADSKGEECQATVVARNQDSEHPNSDLLITSATSVEVRDVENTAYGTVFGGGLITLADTVTVTLTLGADEVFSGGLDVEIDCLPFNPTTTTTTTGGPEGVTDSSGGPGGVTDSSGGPGGVTDSSGGPGGVTDSSGGPGGVTDSSGGPGGVTDSSGGPGGVTDSSGGPGGVTDSSGGPGGVTDSSGGPGGTTGATVLGTTITAPDSSAAGSSETLPFTGLPEGGMGGVAFALLALGGLLVLSIRRREVEVIVAHDWQTRVDFYDFEY